MSNDFMLTSADINLLDAEQHQQVKDYLSNPETKEFVSIRVQEWYETEDGMRYSVHWSSTGLTADELSNYNQSGGLWDYASKDALLKHF